MKILGMLSSTILQGNDLSHRDKDTEGVINIDEF